MSLNVSTENGYDADNGSDANIDFYYYLYYNFFLLFVLNEV